MKKIIALLLMVLAVSCLAQPGRKWSWPSNTIIVDANGKEGVKLIATAVSRAASGDLILVYPGTYTEDFTVDKALTIKSVEKHGATLIGTISNTADDVVIVDMVLAPTGNNNPIGGTEYSYTLRGVKVDCDAWDVGDDTTYSYGCDFIPSADSLWEVSGDRAIWHIEESNFGTDIPIAPSGYGGIAVDSGATLVMFNVEAYSNKSSSGTPLFYIPNTTDALHTKILTHNCRLICDGGSVFDVADTSTLLIQQSYLESSHASLPAVLVTDSARVVIDHSWLRNSTSDTSIRFQSRANSEVDQSYFYGCFWSDSTNVAGLAEGTVSVYGVLTVKAAGTSVLDTQNPITYLYGIGRIAVPDGGSVRAMTDGGADLGTEGTEFDSVFAHNVHVDSIEVREVILPDADVGADLGTLGTQFDSLFVDDIDADNIVADDIMVNTTFTVGVSGTLVNAIYRGHAAYTTTAIFDTVLQAGIDNGDYLYWSFANTAKIGSPDAVMSAWISANGDTIFAERAAGGTSGLKWDWKVETVP